MMNDDTTRRDEDATDRWVREVNRLARVMDDYASGTHPSALLTDPYFQRLRSRYLDVAQGGEETGAPRRRRGKRSKPMPLTIERIERGDTTTHITLGGSIEQDHGLTSVDLLWLLGQDGHTARISDENTLVVEDRRGGKVYHITPAGFFRRTGVPLKLLWALIAHVEEGRDFDGAEFDTPQ